MILFPRSPRLPPPASSATISVSATGKKQVRAKRERGMKLTTFARHERLRAQLATVLDLSGAAGRAAAPVVDLLVRLALAKAFFAPGMFPGICAGDLLT